MSFSLEVVPSAALPPAARAEVVALCSAAYEEDFAVPLALVGPGVHVLGRAAGELVAHAMWVDRTLAPAGLPPLRTAYVEAVATAAAHRRRGYATAVLRGLAAAIRGYDLGALSPSDRGFYARLGWEPWRGPLSVRAGGRDEPTPGEEVMVLRLPGTPAGLDPSGPLAVDWRPGEVW